MRKTAQAAIAVAPGLRSGQDCKCEGKGARSTDGRAFRTVPGLKVVEHRVRTETEEIDLVIANEGNGRGFRYEAEFILVECKKWSEKCGKDEFVLFEKKIHNRRQRGSLGFLVSWNGFTDTFTQRNAAGVTRTASCSPSRWKSNTQCCPTRHICLIAGISQTPGNTRLIQTDSVAHN